MKVIIQIPCFNESKTLAATIADLPVSLEGVDTVEYLVIDDGSKDNTSELARELGVHHVVRHRRNRGLASAFRTGLNHSLLNGADIIVNTDGDNQYAGGDVQRLVQPIIDGEADIVIGDRQVQKIAHFSPVKKFISRLGSAVVRRASKTDVPDAVSGFRAISRDAALKIHIVSSFSYTIEMLLQAGRKQMSIVSVPVGTNEKLRESRLFKSIPQFLAFSGLTLMRIYAMLTPLRFFVTVGLFFGIVGLFPILRFFYFYLVDAGSGHIQSLILGGVLLVIGVLISMIGVVADLISFNRQLIESTLEKVKEIETQMKHTSESEKK
ncbi:MAG: glycosyltransferase family 2 protein [Magnetococcales bacterium]|nr:glycosyltransferase family 2 protein [Magnetococcales bacterium]